MPIIAGIVPTTRADGRSLCLAAILAAPRGEERHTARPHPPSTVNGASYTYDTNGNLTGGGGCTYTWTAENLPLRVS